MINKSRNVVADEVFEFVEAPAYLKSRIKDYDYYEKTKIIPLRLDSYHFCVK